MKSPDLRELSAFFLKTSPPEHRLKTKPRLDLLLTASLFSLILRTINKDLNDGKWRFTEPPERKHFERSLDWPEKRGERGTV